MASTPWRFIYFYGYKSWKSPFMEWFAIDVNNNNNKSCYSDNVLKLPLFQLIDPRPCMFPIAVSLGSKIYCFLFGAGRVLCLDTSDPEIGWREIYSPFLNYRSDPLTVVADGKIYVIGGCPTSAKSWADVFDPSSGKWDALMNNPPPPPPPPVLDSFSSLVIDDYSDGDGCSDDSSDASPLPNCSDVSFFAASLALDDDGAGVSRKVILLASYVGPDIYVYDLEAKSWLLPLPPKLDSSFFYSTEFGYFERACKPVLVEKTVYWYTRSRFLCAYDVETREYSVAYFQNLELMVESTPDDK